MDMEKFNAELSAFFRDLYEDEKKVLVFGEGKYGAKVMMIGEAPGEQESLQGSPFVGKAGKNLDGFLQEANLKRSELYVTNAVKFRPTRISESGRVVNRPPTQEEIKLFLPWLLREIEMVNPRCIVTLGNVPLKALVDRKSTIGDLHGQWISWNGRLLFPLYHPASIIYNPSIRTVYQEDILKFADWHRSQTHESDENKNN